MSYTQLFRLDGRRAAVVGAGAGIGREAALALAAHGAEVICLDRDLEGAEVTAAAARGQITEDDPPGGTEQPLASAAWLDLTDGEAVAAAAAEHDPVDVLVFTPAINVRKRLLDYERAEFDRVVALNLGGAFDLVRSVGRGMAERGHGSIIGFSSIRATTVEPGQGVYAATKAGLIQLLRTAAAELGPAGVRCNAIAPGIVETPLTDPITRDPDWYGAYAAKTALGRWAQPSELAGAVVYLASEAASFVTGSVVTVDGGWTAIDGRFEPPS